MKRINYKMIVSAILVAGFFIGILKGQETRNRWTSKMKYKHSSRKMKAIKCNSEVTLDDYEISSFHKM